MTANQPESCETTTQVPAGSRVRNLLIALVAIFLSTTIFLGLRTDSGSGLLAATAKESVPLETALTNGKPSLIEFYADWCTSCQAMAPEIKQLKQVYGDRVNFVMLNVDNSKWLPEVLQYRVDGIPHFVFAGQDGQALAEAIGEQPRSIMAANLTALIDQQALPYATATGQTSTFAASSGPTKASAVDPRSHGSQVVN
ncbi:MAG TPA: thioredoxin family protein [Coleofasciculaceae cyanobacterium]